MIDDAASGDTDARSIFASTYAPVVRAALNARWKVQHLSAHIDDAVQDVFVELLRDGGAIGKADRSRPEGFRAFLFGVTRNVARRYEQQRRKTAELITEPEDPDARLSVSFDMAWARTMLQLAVEDLQDRAMREGDDAMRRVDLLRRRFQDGLPIRTIAALWDVDPQKVHHAYAAARKEFERSLERIVRDHGALTIGEDESSWKSLLAHLL